MKSRLPLESLTPEIALKKCQGGLVKLFLTSGGRKEARVRVLFEFYKTNVLVRPLASRSSTGIE